MSLVPVDWIGGPNWERFAIKLEKIPQLYTDSAQYDTARNLTLCSLILRGTWLRAVWYCAELSPQILMIDSAQYDTARNLTPHSMILLRTWLCAVWYCAELDSAQYNTVWNIKKIRISWRKRNQKQNYFNPLVSWLNLQRNNIFIYLIFIFSWIRSRQKFRIHNTGWFISIILSWPVRNWQYRLR